MADLIAGVRRDQERRGVLESSIERRESVLRLFQAWCAPKNLLKATRTDVERFLDSRSLGASTRATYLSHLHAFYSWAMMEDLTKDDPTARIVRPKVRRRLPRPASSSELSAALAKATPVEAAWISLAALEGLRCKEIAELRVEDVLMEDRLLRVVGKGDKERLIPLHPDVADALEDLPLPARGFVFTRYAGNPWDPKRLSEALNAALKNLGVNSTAHQLRHWFGTNVYQSTHDLRLTQEMLGHSSPATTAIYTAFDREDATRAVSGLSLG